MKLYVLHVARTDFVQNVFGIGSKQDGLNQECRMRSRNKNPVKIKKVECRIHMRIA